MINFLKKALRHFDVFLKKNITIKKILTILLLLQFTEKHFNNCLPYCLYDYLKENNWMRKKSK